MTQVEINNEIILLRRTVRQARVCIVNKLIREAQQLRNKHGNETQKEKNKRKADKLIAEVYALKTIKDDDITKFGIMNERKISDVLQDQSLSNSDHIMVKIVRHKSLYGKLMQFKEKFPDYEKYLTKRKNKKSTKSKTKISAKSKNILKKDNVSVQNINSEKQIVNSNKDIESQRDAKDIKETCKTELLSETKSNLHKHSQSNEENMDSDKEKLRDQEENSSLNDIIVNAQLQASAITLCGVTKEATVKRFTELIEQNPIEDAQTSAENSDPICVATVEAKPTDDFFITRSDQEDYNDNHVHASTSYPEPHTFNTRIETFESNDTIKIQKYNKNDKKIHNFPKVQKYSQLKNKFKKKDISQSKKQTTTRQERRMLNINKEDSTGLHPSWIAKRKQQESIHQGFQGKRIVFTDD